VILSSKIYEQQRYLSLTQHLYSAAALVVSKKLWDKLSPADREILIAAAQQGAHRQRNRVNTEELRALEYLRNVGVAVNLYVDGAAFRRMMRPRYAELFPGVDKEVVVAILNNS
jgi:TRAP-type C4-dicarboxylate transport system substrate-binding protein